MTLLMAYEIIKFSTEIPLLLTGILTTNIFSQEEEEQQQQLDMQFPTFSGEWIHRCRKPCQFILFHGFNYSPSLTKWTALTAHPYVAMLHFWL